MGRVSFIEQLPEGSAEYMAASEHLHQSAFFEYVRKSRREILDVTFAVPNGGSRHKVEAAKMKLEGVTAGIPDVIVAVPNFRSPGLFLEFKGMSKSDKPSDIQIEKLQALRGRGYVAIVVHGWLQAVECLEQYLLNGCAPEGVSRFGVNYSAQLEGNYTPDHWLL